VTPERWTRVEALFHRALGCEPEQRAQLLDGAGKTDPELRQEVESLLACQGSATKVLRAEGARLYRIRSGEGQKP